MHLLYVQNLGQDQNNQSDHQSTRLSERQNHRVRWRTSQGIWRAAIGPTQRDEILARRRAEYHGQHNSSGDNTRGPNRMRLSHIRQLARSNRSEVPEHGVFQTSTNTADDMVVNGGITFRTLGLHTLNHGVNVNTTSNDEFIVLNDGNKFKKTTKFVNIISIVRTLIYMFIII